MLARTRTRIAHEMRALPRQFWLLMGGTFIYLVGVEMCFPFETLYLTEQRGFAATTVGLMLGVTQFVGLPFHVLGGALADRLGRKLVLAVAICGSMSLYIALGLVTSFWVIVVFIVVEAAFGWAQFLTATNAMLADLTPLARRAEAYSVHRVFLNAGMVLGPLIAAVLIAADPTYRTTFLAGGAVCGVFLVLVVTSFRETRPHRLGAQESVAATMLGYARVLGDRRYMLFCLVCLPPLYCFGQIWSWFPVSLERAHGVDAGRWSILLAVYALTAALLQYPVIRALRRRDHLLLMTVATALFTGGLVLGVFAPYGWVTFAAVSVIALGVVIWVPIASTIVAELAPVELRGRYMGAWTLVFIAGFALGPTFGGLALDALGPRGAFTVIGVAGAAGAALYPLLRGVPRRREDALAVEEPPAPPA